MSATEPTTIALLHEQGVTRSAFGQHLKRHTEHQLVCAVDDVPALKRAFALGPVPSVVILSLRYRDLLPWLMQHATEAAVLVHGPDLPDEDQVDLFRKGAHAYCCEQCELDELLAMVVEVRQGAIHFSRTALARIRALLPSTVAKPAVSERQEEFLRLVSSPDAPSYERIAELMHVGVNMVYKYRNKLCARFGLKGKSALVRFAVMHFARRDA